METLFSFLIELDKLKSVYRRSYISDGSRNENSAEHSWHLAMALLTLKAELDLPINLERALKLALIHDICEIDAGDISIYDPDREKVSAIEKSCIERIARLGPVFASELPELWLEYEEQKTIESIWVKVTDRLIPFMMNLATEGRTWKEQKISKSQVLAINQFVSVHSVKVYSWIEQKVNEAVAKGWLVEH